VSGYIRTESGWRFADRPYDDVAPRVVALTYLDDALTRLAGLELDRIEGLGACDDCEHATLTRFVVGTFVLCRGCASSRVRAAERADAA
jgi:hypothetical protein